MIVCANYFVNYDCRCVYYNTLLSSCESTGRVSSSWVTHDVSSASNHPMCGSLDVSYMRTYVFATFNLFRRRNEDRMNIFAGFIAV